MLKIFIAIIAMGILELCVESYSKDHDIKREKIEDVGFEIALSIIFGAWIISGGNLLW